MYQLSDLKMEIIDNKLAQNIIKKYHYSNSCGNLKFAFAFKYEHDIKNVIAYTSPIGRLVCQEIIENGSNDNILELVRMVSIEPKPKNMESYCIHKTFEYIKKYLPKYKIVVSFADNSVGHHGYCYQASGFIYYGQSSAHDEWFLDGKRIHEKSLFNKFGTVCYQDLKKILGNRIIKKKQKETKSKYYYIIAQNKKEKKEIQNKIKVKSLPFPKGNNKRYNVFEKNNFANLDGVTTQKKDDIVIGTMSIFDFIEE